MYKVGLIIKLWTAKFRGSEDYHFSSHLFVGNYKNPHAHSKKYAQ